MQLFQGEKPAHDFLSLHTGGSASSPVQHSAQAPVYDLGVHNTMKPLKMAKERGRGVMAMASSGLEADSGRHALPGGAGTFGIKLVSSAQSRGEAASHGVVRGALAPGLQHGPRTEGAHGAESGARAHSGPSTMWQDSGTDQRSRTTREGRSSGSSADQGPSTPRSKHSATEQRRRTKINDRLEILRELLPHADQKRDKASFLLEVIEYIKFLQEKVQKYESANPERNHEDSKSMPWEKVYYRSCWKNTQNIQGGGLSPSTQNVNKEQCGSKPSTVAPAALFSTHGVRETSTDVSPSQKAANAAQNWEKKSTPSKQPPWLSISSSDSGDRPLSTNERETVHKDTCDLSNAYSQGLLHRLTEALKRSGVDPSQAKISVEINMDRGDREHGTAHDSSKTDEGDECNQVAKRLRCDTS